MPLTLPVKTDLALDHRLVESMYLGPQIFRIDCGAGIYSYISDPQSPTANYVGLDPEHQHTNLRGMTEVTADLFNKNHTAFCWICSSGEKELVEILNRTGYKKGYSFCGMYHRRNEPLPARNRRVSVDEVQVDLLRKNANIIARELNCSLQHVEQTLRFDRYQPSENVRAYAAFLTPRKLIGFGLLIEDQDRSFALLRMAVVLPDYKRLGAYRELFRHRVSDAYASGLPLVVAHAYETTAAPILETFGMRRQQGFTMYPSPFCKEKFS